MTIYNNTGILAGPYKEVSINLLYNWLFCDNIMLFKEHMQQPYLYPWNILLSEETGVTELQNIINGVSIETRAKIMAYNLLRQKNSNIEQKELLAVIVEVGLNNGLDVLAAFKDGTARYINQTGKVIVWESADEISDNLVKELFANSIPIIQQIGPWNDARRPHPEDGMARISFLVSDGLYFGEAPLNALFNDALAKPALLSATSLMQFLTEKVLHPSVN